MEFEQLIDGLTREQAVIWAAGFIDGEGSIGLRPCRGGRNVSLWIQATQVDPSPLLRLQALWGGSVRTRNRTASQRADYYHWFLWARRAADCCAELQPYLTVKRAHAALAIQFQKTRHLGNRNGQATDNYYRASFAVLNRRGPQGHAAGARINLQRPQSPQLHLLEEAVS